MKKLILFYNFLITTIMALSGFLGATSYPQLFSAVLFFPLAVYFWLLIIPKQNKAIIIPNLASKVTGKKKSKHAESSVDAEEPIELTPDGEEIDIQNIKFTGNVDRDRRMFLKLIGSAGLSLFMLSIFTKKAQAAFFGSVPGPGTVAIKDASGSIINPAEKQPTDGYRISRLDDSVPAYYGFTNKNGNWFIMKEDASGNYTYAVGSSSFTTWWGNRAASPPTGPTYQEYSDAF